VAKTRIKTGGRQPSAPADTPKNICGANIRIARRQRQPKLLLAELSALVGAEGIRLDVNALSKIERGQREVTDIELKAIAAALNRSIKWIVNELDTI
jgi:transcriptional regulator with XRE-family HTH domain